MLREAEGARAPEPRAKSHVADFDDLDSLCVCVRV